MLSRKELEEIIKAWPDKDGKSSNPEVYENWLEMQKQTPYKSGGRFGGFKEGGIASKKPKKKKVMKRGGLAPKK